MLNTLQRLIVKDVFDYMIQNKGRFFVIKENQLLLYINGKKEIGKNCLIYALKIGFIFLNKKNKFIILVLIRFAA